MGGQYFKGSDFAKVSPVITIRGPNEACVVVTEVLSGEYARPVGENDVVFRKTFFGC
jgi:hypothetical protein